MERDTETTDGDLIFQTLDWYCKDVENKFVIYSFGVNDKPVTLQINNFCPFFFIEVPRNWDQSCIYKLKEKFYGVKSLDFIKRKKYYGFENGMLHNFVKITFYNLRSMKSLRWKIEKDEYQIFGTTIRFQLYESNIDPILRFTHLRDILTAGWIIVKKEKLTNNYECDWNSINNYPEYNLKLSNIRVLYFDIEACSEDGSFPNALKKNDHITQICCIIKDTTGYIKKYLFNLGTIDPVEGTEVFQFKSERSLLNGYCKFINDTNPDIIVGYNIFGFDNGYLFERAQVLEIESFCYQSKLNDHRTDIIKKVLNNQQSGFNDWKMTPLIGRIHIDLLQVIKKDFKLESYKLNYVGEHFLGEGKDDVTPKEIFEAWSATGTREKRTIVGKYCVQDTNLCLLLFEKFAVLANHIEMAKVTRVPLEYLISRGQSIKVFSQISYETRKAGFLIPVLPRSTDSDGVKFQGATVLEAKVGYYQKPVAGLDFASLYPSIMIAYNMCYSTIVLDPKYLGLPGVEYHNIDCGKGESFTFVQNQPGVLSGILESLWKNRKITKKEMNTATDPFLKSVLNAKQLAIKVSMNSIYGFTGASIGALPCLEISQSVTGCGRTMIDQTSKIAKEHFMCEIVYGDSVTFDTPILLKLEGITNVISISALFNQYSPEDYPQFKMDDLTISDKEQAIPDKPILAWTSVGWSPIKRIIRHHCNKRIYRIITITGVVDVTEDHSLLDSFKKEIKPSELHIGETLLSSYPFMIDTILTSKEKYFLGYLKSVNETTMTFDNKLEASRYYLLGKSINYDVIIDCYLECITLKFYKYIGMESYFVTDIIPMGIISDYVYDIETETGNFQAGVGQIIVKNTDSCYVIFPEPPDADGSLTTLFKKAEEAADYISLTFKKPIQLEFEKFMYPLILVAKKRYMYIEWTDPKKGDTSISAKGVELVRRDNCPYVKETLDAVLSPIMFKNNLEIGKHQAEIHIDRLLNGEVPIKKLILSKNLRNDYKGYQKKYLQDGNYQWIHTKGDIVTEKCPTMAHVALVEKMRKRDPNSAPKPGDRVPFVYIDIGNPKALSWEKTEDPEYVIENNVKIDTLYYLEHQLKNPLKTIFDILLGELKCEEMFNRPSLIKAKQREKISIGEAKRVKEKNKDIRSFFITI